MTDFCGLETIMLNVRFVNLVISEGSITMPGWIPSTAITKQAGGSSHVPT
jgi:hypothetical protein